MNMFSGFGKLIALFRLDFRIRKDLLVNILLGKLDRFKVWGCLAGYLLRLNPFSNYLWWLFGHDLNINLNGFHYDLGFFSLGDSILNFHKLDL